MPNGVAFHKGDLYVAEVDKLWVFKNIEDNLENPGDPILIYDDYPKDKHHGWKYIAFGPDGKLYVPVGAPCNICESKNKMYASITRMNPDGSDREIFAYGVRNTVGFTWNPNNDEMWFTDNGRDMLGDNIPPCELNRVTKPGQNFGYPYCHGDDIGDPEFGGKYPCSDFVPPARNLGPHVAPLGLKFYKITDYNLPLGEKAFYLENEAKKKAAEHADAYLLARSKQLEKLTLSSSFKPLLVAPFDAELFGHWWYEGPFFIENILKNSNKYSIKLTNLKEFLIQKPNLQICDPSPSSWGQGGYHNYWINDANAWIVPEITKAGSTFVDLCSKNFNNDLSPRLFKQAARELLLSESSDWSFILRAGTTTELAKERIERHLFRFWKIVEMIKNHSNINLKFLEDIEEEDKVFPDINIDDWRK